MSLSEGNEAPQQTMLGVELEAKAAMQVDKACHVIARHGSLPRPALRDLPDHGHVDLGVVSSRVRGAVPEDSTHPVQRRAGTQHAGRRGMPQEIGASCRSVVDLLG